MKLLTPQFEAFSLAVLPVWADGLLNKVTKYMTLRKTKKRDPKNGLTIKNDRQAMKVLGLLEQDKNKEVYWNTFK